MAISGNDVVAFNKGRHPRPVTDPTIGAFSPITNRIVETILRDLLARGITLPCVEILVQYPLPSNIGLATDVQLANAAQALALDGIISVTITRNEDPTSDTLDFSVSNGDGRYLPPLT